MSDQIKGVGTAVTPEAASGQVGKRILKAAARGGARGLVAPIYLSYVVRSALFGEQAFRASSQFLSLWPGFLGDFLRSEFYRLTLSGCGRDVQICHGTLFSSRMAVVGNNVYIGAFCNIGNVEIGRDVLLGSNVHLVSGQNQHGIADLSRPVRLQPGRVTRIVIGDDTWIGNGAIVMANVGDKCVIGAGSVVVSDIPSLSIAAGNPARVIRARA